MQTKSIRREDGFKLLLPIYHPNTHLGFAHNLRVIKLGL